MSSPGSLAHWEWAQEEVFGTDFSDPLSTLPSISPGNIWTPLWEEVAASMPDPKATIREGTLAQVGEGQVKVECRRLGMCGHRVGTPLLFVGADPGAEPRPHPYPFCLHSGFDFENP